MNFQRVILHASWLKKHILGHILSEFNVSNRQDQFEFIAAFVSVIA